MLFVNESSYLARLNFDETKRDGRPGANLDRRLGTRPSRHEVSLQLSVWPVDPRYIPTLLINTIRGSYLRPSELGGGHPQ